MLGGFMAKNTTLGKDIYYFKKIDKVETKCGVRQMITIICVAYVQKNF